MRTKHAAIGVHFINHNKAQIAEEVRPVRMMRQDAGMKHVGIAQDDARVLADQAALWIEAYRRHRLMILDFGFVIAGIEDLQVDPVPGPSLEKI